MGFSKDDRSQRTADATKNGMKKQAGNKANDDEFFVRPLMFSSGITWRCILKQDQAHCMDATSPAKIYVATNKWQQTKVLSEYAS